MFTRRTPSKLSVVLSLFAAAALIATAMPQSATARPPPVCKPPRVKLSKALKRFKRWRGFAPLKGLKLAEAHIAPCLSTNRRARLFAMVIAKHGKAQTRWQGDIIVSIKNRSGKPVDTKAARAQLKRVATQLRELPPKALRDSIVAGWTTVYGVPKVAILSDEGGHGTPCFELMEAPKAPSVSLSWCGKGVGVSRLSLRSYSEVPISALFSARQDIKKLVGQCTLGQTLVERKHKKSGPAMWKISVQLGGGKHCTGSAHAVGNAKVGWKVR